MRIGTLKLLKFIVTVLDEDDCDLLCGPGLIVNSDLFSGNNILEVLELVPDN